MKRKSPPSSIYQSRDTSAPRHSPIRDSSPTRCGSVSARELSNGSWPSVRENVTLKIQPSTIKTRDLNIKPLPCLPPQRRYHRISMKPPSFIPLDLTLPGAFYSEPRSVSPLSSVQSPRSVRVVKNFSSSPFNNNPVKSAEVTDRRRPFKTLSETTNFDPLLWKKFDQENQKPTRLASELPRNAGRLQRASRPSLANRRANKSINISGALKEFTGTAPRSGATQAQERQISTISPRTALSKPTRSSNHSKGGNGRKSVPRKPGELEIATGKRWELL